MRCMKQKKEGEIVLLFNKKVLVAACVVVLYLSGCTSHQDSGYYDRANKASEKALDKLDRE